jgi:hypothetical protein
VCADVSVVSLLFTGKLVFSLGIYFWRSSTDKSCPLVLVGICVSDGSSYV